MGSMARGVMYVLLSVLGLLFAGMVFAVGALLGTALGAMAFAGVQAVAPRAQAEQGLSLFCTGGALFGGGWGLLVLARVWLSQAMESEDPAVRRFGHRLDKLNRVMRAPV